MKKYKIGFTAGTYDMFHVGHLNLLKNAKEQCEKLIVGVNSDSLVQTYKSKTPLINEYDRKQIVSAIRYVDEVHIMNTLDKIVALDMFNFDVVFIGSDYVGSERYIKVEKELAARNIALEFIDYTERVSSTILSERIIKNELNRNYYHLQERD